MSNYKEGRLEQRYEIRKTNGNPVDPKAEYFVLRIDRDVHAIVALAAYAASVKKDNSKLAADLDVLIVETVGVPRGWSVIKAMRNLLQKSTKE